MSSGFVVCFGITVVQWRMEPKMVHNREDTKRRSIFMCPRSGQFCVLLIGV